MLSDSTHYGVLSPNPRRKCIQKKPARKCLQHPSRVIALLRIRVTLQAVAILLRSEKGANLVSRLQSGRGKSLVQGSLVD
jgi:hypothetical protein